MALSDTAALVASLELKDQFSATANKFDRTLAGMEQRVSTFGKISGQVSAGIGQASQNLQRLGLIGIGLIGANVAAGIQTIARLEEVTAATNAVIESTGGVAGITAQKVRELAEEYESLNATMDDKVIQSAENLLLTFTNIGEDAFEPALEAALNLNQALGGGEEGLQGTLIQVAKALNDPARGLTALRRSGVSFTQAQIDQIKALQEANDLFGAQQIILQELATQFGGQFAAAGDTATAKFARLKDAIEDAQVALATALLPVLEKVTEKLTTFLESPENLAALEQVGVNLADAFDSLMEIAGNLPWDAIGNTFQLMGTGSKALLDAFTGLPPWVQTAVLTGWGLNKLTGGMLTGIAGTLIGATRGSSPANPVFVSGVGVGGPGGGGLTGVQTALLGGAAVGGAAIGGISSLEQISSGTEEGVKSGFAAISGGFAGLIAEAVEWVIGDPFGDIADALGEEERNAATRAGLQEHLLRENSTKIGESNRELVTSRTHLATLAAKPAPKTNVNVNVVSSVAITDITRRLVSQRISIGGTGGITIE